MDYSTFYVTLDCLLDTRIATLFTFGEKAVQQALDQDYYTRESDHFPGTDKAAFDARYAARDASILTNAMATPILTMLQEFVVETLQHVVNSPFHHQPKIVVNIHPYVLDEATIQVIIRMLIAKTNQRADIEVISKSVEELTPAYVKQQYSIMVMYDYYVWLERHSETGDLRRVTCPEVTLIGPAINFKGPLSPNDLAKAKSLNLTPYKAMELAAGPFIGLQLIAIENFCMALKLKKASPT